MKRLAYLTTLTALIGATAATAADWPMWGRTPHRNMTAPAEKNLPAKWNPGQINYDTEQVDLTDATHVKWVTKLGSQSYGNPTVADGRIFLGTNNAFPRDAKYTNAAGNPEDRSVVMCLDEKTGKFIWQLAVPKLGAGKVSDWEYLGICSSPAVEGEVVYVVTNRCEVVALDVNGLADGNDGPFKDEAKYLGVDELSDTDGDILWRYDMREELGVFPHNVTSTSPLVVGDMVIVATSNGVDWSHTNIPSPRAPAMIVLDKKTGELVAEEASGISQRMLHSNWSSPAYAKFGGQAQIIFGAGDGLAYGYDARPVKDEDGFDVLKELWRIDCNPPEYWQKDGKPIKYTRYEGPSEIIGTPVVYEQKVYVTIGQDPEHGEGVGALTCIDPTKRGDISKSGLVWRFKGIGRSISTPAIADGLVYISDYAGKVYCVDADTGELHWEHDTRAHIWGSPLLADGKVYIGNEEGTLFVFAHDKQKKVLGQMEKGAPLYGSAIAANGRVYVMTMTHLYAIGGEGE